MSIDIDIRALGFFVRDMGRQIDFLGKLHGEGLRWSADGPGRRGIFVSARANAQVTEGHVVYTDHSLRLYAYAQADEYERNLPPFMRTYIFSDPPRFMIGSEDTRGELVMVDWEGAMRQHGIPDAFIQKIKPTVEQAIARYDDHR